MKQFLSVLSTILVLGSSLPLHAQDAKAEAWRPGWMWDSAILRQVRLRLENAKTSEQLITLAKASEFNIFADATLFPSTSQPVTIDTSNYLRSWILETASVEQLSWRRTGERTLLFWKEPDVIAVTKALIAETKAQTITQTTAQTDEKEARMLASMARASQNTESQETGLFLADYLQKQRGWDGKSPLRLEFKLSELPPQLATELLGTTRSSLNRSRQDNRRRWMEDAPWLSDESWRGARLLYSQPPRQPRAILAVRSTKGNVQNLAALEGRTLLSPPMVEKQQNGETALIQPLTKDFPNLTGEELAKEEGLANPISLEVKEATLGDLLSEMQKQGGVTLKLSPVLDSRRRVTARATALPLYQVMNALNDLYGIGWAKAPDGSYLMQSELSPARAGALQIGDPDWFQYWRSQAVQKIAPARLTLDEPVDWQSELLKAGVDEAMLRAPDGVAVSALPPELQTLVRRAVESYFALKLMSEYDKAFVTPTALSKGREEDVTVRVAPPEHRRTVRRGNGPPIDISPLLKVTLVEDGEAVYSFDVHGPQARQDIAEMVRRSHKSQEALQQMVERRQNRADANEQ